MYTAYIVFMEHSIAFLHCFFEIGVNVCHIALHTLILVCMQHSTKSLKYRDWQWVPSEYSFTNHSFDMGGHKGPVWVWQSRRNPDRVTWSMACLHKSAKKVHFPMLMSMCDFGREPTLVVSKEIGMACGGGLERCSLTWGGLQYSKLVASCWRRKSAHCSSNWQK